MKSIRQTLVTRLLASLAALAFASGLLLFVGVRIALIRELDRTLTARLDAMKSVTRWDGEAIDVDFTTEAMPWYLPGPEAEYFEIRTVSADDAAPVSSPRSPSLGKEWDAPFLAGSDLVDVVLPDGRPGRAALETFRPLPEETLDQPGWEESRRQAVKTAPTVRLAVALDRSDLDTTLRIVAFGLLAAAGAMTLGIVVAVRSSVARSMAPLETLSAQVGQIGEETLSTRFDGAELPKELRPIRDRLNGLLQRLDGAFAREQRFTATAAHELRTPVAELRSLLEVSLARPRTTDDYRAVLEESLEITLRAERLVTTLLTLARGRGGHEVPGISRIRPGSVLQRLAAQHMGTAKARGGGLEVTVRSDPEVRADPTVLESVINNVLTNAVEYASPTPVVKCDVFESAEGDWAIIEVRNPAVGLDMIDVDRFFEPFWRRDQTRTSSNHVGMGLSIARSLLERMGGTIGATLETGAVVVVRLTLGRAEPTAEPTRP